MNELVTSGGTKVENPGAEDIARALTELRDDDWYLNLARGDDDYMEMTIDDGSIELECESAGVYVFTRSYVDDAAAKSMLTAFLEGSDAWRDQALWKEPAKAAAKPKELPLKAIIPGVAVAFFVILSIVTDGPWFIVGFALLFPGIIAAAALTKMSEVKRAAAWTKASARILRSELGEVTRQGKPVKVPKVEYEYSVGFNVFRGDRISIGETAGPYGADVILARYKVGTSVPVYYDRDDPRQSVLERDLPKGFHLVWVVVGVIVALIAAAAYWFLGRSP